MESLSSDDVMDDDKTRFVKHECVIYGDYRPLSASAVTVAMRELEYNL